MAYHAESQILLETDDQGRLVLPKNIRGNKRQSYYCQSDNDGTITLVPIVGVITKNEAYFWSKRWQTGEKEATADIQKNRTKKIPATKLKKYLDSL